MIDWSDWAWWLPALLDAIEDDDEPLHDVAWLTLDDADADTLYAIGYTGQAWPA